MFSRSPQIFFGSFYNIYCIQYDICSGDVVFGTCGLGERLNQGCEVVVTDRQRKQAWLAEFFDLKRNAHTGRRGAPGLRGSVAHEKVLLTLEHPNEETTLTR